MPRQYFSYFKVWLLLQCQHIISSTQINVLILKEPFPSHLEKLYPSDTKMDLLYFNLFCIFYFAKYAELNWLEF